jgi:hypothetical protein
VAALDRVRGALEISVRIAANGELPLTSPTQTGRDYLRAKARLAELREEAARSVHEPLAARARMTTRRVARQPPELLRCAYLVERAALDEFLAAAAKLDSEVADFTLVCTGPWPPYSFVGS